MKYLINKIKNAFFAERKLYKKKYNRILPFGEYISDRWEKAQALGFGKGSSIYDSAIIIGNVVVGDNTWIGPNVILDGSGNLEIGDNCSISAGVHIYTHDTVDWSISRDKKPYLFSSVKIGNNCYIGPNAVISKGVCLGDGCIVGALSFVNKSFPGKTKIVGQPAKKSKSINI